MDAEVVDAEDSGDTNDVKGAIAEVEDFNFDNVLDKESDYAFLQDAIVCENENEVVLDLRGKDCIYNQEHQDGEDSTDILLDNQSTVHMVVNFKFLKNVRVSKQVLRLYTSDGMTRVIHEGDMPGVGVVQCYADGIANVISQAKAVRENGFEIDYSTRKNKNGSRDLTFCVETKEGVKLKFVLNKKGLHVLDCKSHFGPGKDGCVF